MRCRVSFDVALARGIAAAFRWRGGVALAAILSSVGFMRDAQAFEHQWHLGVGLGVANPSLGDMGIGPAASLYGAYGLTDMFDLKLDLNASDHPVPSIDERRRVYLGTLGLSYKIDVIEWIPYFGGSGGYLVSDWVDPADGEELRDVALGGFVGLDYALNRELGVGVVSRAHWLLGGGVISDGFLRLEYRWGW